MSVGGLSGEDEAIDLVGSIYDAALDTQLWPDLLNRWLLPVAKARLKSIRLKTRIRQIRFFAPAEITSMTLLS